MRQRYGGAVNSIAEAMKHENTGDAHSETVRFWRGTRAALVGSVPAALAVVPCDSQHHASKQRFHRYGDEEYAERWEEAVMV